MIRQVVKPQVPEMVLNLFGHGIAQLVHLLEKTEEPRQLIPDRFRLVHVLHCDSPTNPFQNFLLAASGFSVHFTSFTKHAFYLFNRERHFFTVDDEVTIWANRTQITDRVHFIFTLYLGQRSQVMYMNLVFADRPINLLKIKPTYNTLAAVVLNAGVSGFSTSFVSVNIHRINSPFRINRLFFGADFPHKNKLRIRI